MSADELSILCVTRAESCILPLLEGLARDARDLGAELVVFADGHEAAVAVAALAKRDAFRLAGADSAGYIESVLEQAIAATSRPYVLRIDDDESLSPGLLAWLRSGAYRAAEHWKFNRAHLLGDLETYVTTPPLWPDHQTRLSVRHLAGGRSAIHAGSPFGGGQLAPDAAVVLHHKFLVKTREERQEIADRYERLQPGAGRDFAAFSIPETLLLKDVASLDSIPGYTVARAIEAAFAVGMHQHRGEIEPFAAWLLERKPHNVIEIGTLHGGTATLWHGLCSGKVISIDLPGGRFGGADHGLNEQACRERSERLSAALPRFVGVLGDSQGWALSGDTTLAETKAALGGDLADLLFIDGDHSRAGVEADFRAYSRLVRPGGVIAFHDVLDTPLHRAAGCEVSDFWATLPEPKAVFSINGPWGGIGVVFS